MNQAEFFVSVIIPVYNGANFLLETIIHVLAQNYHPLEIIVVDDGSTDETPEVAARLKDKIRYFYQKHNGLISATNYGIRQARGDIITFLKVEEFWSENKLKSQLDYLAHHPQVDIVQGMIIKQNVEYDESQPQGIRVIESSNPYYYPILASSVYRSSTFTKVGLLDETMEFDADVDWFFRAWEQRIEKKVINKISLFSCQANLLTEEKSSTQSGLLKALKKHLDRKRCSQNSLEDSPAVSENCFPSIPHYIGKESPVYSEPANYTIISNDCWGGFVYQSLGHIYETPFIGTFVVKYCYLKLLKNLRHYLNCPIKFTKHSKYPDINKNRETKHYPIGLLDDDIEIHFYHELDWMEAKRKWERRLKRINWNNLFIKFSDPNTIPLDDDLQLIIEFEQLDFPRKVCFTACEYPHLASTIFLPNFIEDGHKIFLLSTKQLDINAWLKQEKGSRMQNYLTN